MASKAGLTDEVIVELNPLPEPAEEREARLAQQLRSLPERPSSKATTAEWVDYVVALGADPSVAEDTSHWEGDKDTGRRIIVKALIKAELIELADRLGG